ncbi:hypothetical protein JRO89_XS12G0078600 [Xanthoceras sorbifolium]|uniref:Uncharacterized protein n=1 Tax=Xanthoceras sorbifolium TaxID=99658 RepID=A0ABQ8HBR4_9ROSI|nr:hypothetical protein JRO89_XS12G0078600 [Xanthoceras sorbifolium]
MRRRSRTRRRIPQDSVINMAEARREIVHALHLHRSSSSRTTSSSSSSATMLESMPLPEPIWSTTEPSIPAATPPVAATMEELEFEWGENQASSHSWWLGFLQALDSKKKIVDNYSKYPCLERITVMGNSRVFGHQDSCKLGGEDEGPNFVDASHDHDQQNSSSPDEWLMFPTTDDLQNQIN